MKHLLLASVLLFAIQSLCAQTISVKVVDSSNSKPLAYAIVLYKKMQRVTYTDNNGFFSIEKDSLLSGDSAVVQYIGYRDVSIAVSLLKNGMVIAMRPAPSTLYPVVVTSGCRKWKDITLNKKTGRIKQYIGPGPETKLIIIARYNNTSGKDGFIKKISVLIDEKSLRLQIPVRLHWYDWDELHNMPGDELTDTSIIVYPYKEGWNDFEIPQGTILCNKDFAVLGLEFIYPPEYKQQFDALQTDKERLRWLNDLENRWSLAMQYTNEVNEGGFYIINNNEPERYGKKYDRYYVRPALKFTITICAE
ncbi:MAG TPA: carboxypeptidase-like regulatory domain-containing protein [Chitinophagaceae bacterium]|nr:carboxypeptidase-like regulatory domain-containing protein [Chitinophagaceae bacterium]